MFYNPPLALTRPPRNEEDAEQDEPPILIGKAAEDTRHPGEEGRAP